MNFLFEIGFLPISLWDLLDVAIVGYLAYRVYLLLRGSIAFNIFIGIVTLYAVWWLVGVLKMDMLYMLLGQFVNVGFIIIIIIFQPEVRRFLLLLGNTTLGGRGGAFFRWFTKNLGRPALSEVAQHEIKLALLRMSKDKTGALIVLTQNPDHAAISHSGTRLDADISQALLVSLFQKEGPLHDGAVLISKDKILAASCILPVSDSQSLPEHAGLRHRAALGITERTIASAFVVSETTGAISYALNGRMEFGIGEARLTELLTLQQ